MLARYTRTSINADRKGVYAYLATHLKTVRDIISVANSFGSNRVHLSRKIL